MKEIAGFVYDRMQRDNDCWVSAAIMIYNCMRSDKIDRTNRIIQDDPNFRNGQMGSASDLLWKLGIKNYVYTTARFPTREQIGKYIDKNKPFLCCVGADYSGKKPDIAYQGGHWVVIYGYEVSGGTLSQRVVNRVRVADPDPNVGCVTIDYDEAVYGSNYWENTSYMS